MSAFFRWFFVEALRFLFFIWVAGCFPLFIRSDTGVLAAWIVMLVWFAFFLRGTKRALRIGEGVSEDRFVDGQPRFWRFKSGELTLEADFDANTLRVSSPKCQMKKSRAEAGEMVETVESGSVDLVWPLDSCALWAGEQRKLRTYSNVATTMATGTGWVDGQAVTVTAPVTVNTGGGGTYMAATGKFDVSVSIHLSPRKVHSAGCHRTGDGFKSFSSVQRVNYDQDIVILEGSAERSDRGSSERRSLSESGWRNCRRRRTKNAWTKTIDWPSKRS